MANTLRDTRSAHITPPLRPVRLAAPDVVVERRPDGAILMRSPHPLPPYPDTLTERLVHWAKAAPERIFLAQRDAAGGWRTLTYAAALAQMRAIAAALLQRELSVERPIAILSGNDIEHALFGLAAMHVGIPYAPISVPYSLMSQDFGKLKSIIASLTPGLVFAANGKIFSRAIDAAVPAGIEIVVAANPPDSRPATLFSTLAATQPIARRRCRARQSRPRYDRENPVHLGLDRPAEGRHQHPAHAVLEPGDDPLKPCLHRRRAAGAGRLAAVEPHLRRQPRFRHGARQWRLVLYRRGQAAAGRHRGHRAQSARHRADHPPQRAQGLRDAAALSAQRRGVARDASSAGSRCCSTPARGLHSMSGTNCRSSPSPRQASASSFCRVSVRPKPRPRRSLAPGNPSAPAISGCRCGAWS